MGRAAGQVEDDLDILAAGMEDLQHMLVVDQQVEQGREVDPLGLGIDRRRLLAIRRPGSGTAPANRCSRA